MALLITGSLMVGVYTIVDPAAERGWSSGQTLGLGALRPGAAPGEARTAFGMGGAGGTYAYADTATRTAFALAKNRLTPSFDAVNEISGIVAKATGEE